MALIFQKFLRLFRIHQVNAVIIGSKQKHVNRKWTCRIFWQSGFAQVFGQIVPIRVDTAIQIWQRQGILTL